MLGADGVRYLYYRLAGALWVQPLTPDGLATAPDPSTRVLEASEDWEHGNVEAPWVARNGAYYYLFYSGGRACGSEHAVGVARATSPLGPFEKLAQPIVATDAQYAGPGHLTLTRGPGGTLYGVYHAYRRIEGTPSCETGDTSRRHALIGRVVFERGWPRVITP
jgi:beta-xylosidase